MPETTVTQIAKVSTSQNLYSSEREAGERQIVTECVTMQIKVQERQSALRAKVGRTLNSEIMWSIEGFRGSGHQ